MHINTNDLEQITPEEKKKREEAARIALVAKIKEKQANGEALTRTEKGELQKDVMIKMQEMRNQSQTQGIRHVQSGPCR